MIRKWNSLIADMEKVSGLDRRSNWPQHSLRPKLTFSKALGSSTLQRLREASLKLAEAESGGVRKEASSIWKCRRSNRWLMRGGHNTDINRRLKVVDFNPPRERHWGVQDFSGEVTADVAERTIQVELEVDPKDWMNCYNLMIKLQCIRTKYYRWEKNSAFEMTSTPILLSWTPLKCN
jgi:hypothetical protein